VDVGVFVWKFGSVAEGCFAFWEDWRRTATNNRCRCRPQETSACW